jgi:orotidine-5'-phosphate decarboxylase
MKFKHRLNRLIKEKRSLLGVGLDVTPDKLPKFFLDYDNPIVTFNQVIVEATKDLAIAYKPNLAFYEARGIDGLKDLEQTLALIPEHCLTIADAKRGDIGNTSAQYAKAFFSNWSFDSITVSPYMGHDSLEPFLMDENTMTFILCLTSNPGSKDFEEMILQNGDPLYKHVLKTALTWDSKENVGFVVGATKSEQLKEIRDLAPNSVFLIPGIGAQGGSLEAAVMCGTDQNRQSAIIISSRAIIYPEWSYQSLSDYQKGVERKASEMVDLMRQSL